MTILFILGRILFGGFFLYNGIKHILNKAQLIGYAQSKGVTHAKAAVLGSGILILLGGFMVIVGLFPRLGLVFIATFLVGVTFKMHRFWKITDPQMRAMEKIQFTKNMALLGAVLMMLGLFAEWPLSILFA
jgi:uncharacterized membrane protein YphA (DoxX/SURF4 family)